MIGVLICVVLMAGTAFWANYEFADWIPFAEHAHHATLHELGLIAIGVMSLLVACIAVILLCIQVYRGSMHRAVERLRQYLTDSSHRKSARLIISTNMHGASLYRNHLALLERALADQ